MRRAAPPPVDAPDPTRAPVAEGDPYRLSRRTTVLLVGVFLGIAAAAVLSMVGLPFVVMQPGPISNTLGSVDGKRLINVSGAETYPTEGSLDFTTVSVIGGPGERVTVWDVLLAGLDPASEVYPEEAVFPRGVTSEQVEEESAERMLGSQQEAIAVALGALGQRYTEHVTIAGVAPDAPSRDAFREGDEVVSVGGTPVSGAQQLRELIQRTRPGDTLTVGLRRDGAPVTVQARTREVEGRTAVGIFLARRFDFPYRVQIEAGEVGGPSAGLMFALGVYDILTPGAMTAGTQVAGTGTIEVGGEVGPIGGIRQKLVGAREGGARWFLAPADNCDEVVGHVPDGLRVVPVSTFEQARATVQDIAAGTTGQLPRCGR